MSSVNIYTLGLLRKKKSLVLHIDSMTTHQFNNQASSLGFQVLFLCLRVVTVVFIFLGKEVGEIRFYHTVVVQNKVHL